MTDVVKHVVDNSNLVELTSAARSRILSYLTTHSLQGLRLSLKKTGCSGLSYDIDYVDSKLENDAVFDIDDGKFICIEKKSLPFLRGVKIDYVQQGISQKFVFDNPNQTGQCGCGESFTVDDM